MLMLVAGLPGSGKTTWIRERLTEAGAYYCSTTDFPLDQAVIETEFPGQVLHTDDLITCQDKQVYMEVGHHLDLSTVSQEFIAHPQHRIMLGSAPLDSADQLLSAFSAELTDSQLLRLDTTGRVLEVESLDTFWQELVQGAYGVVGRVKALVAVNNGEWIYGNFVRGMPGDGYFDTLAVSRWSEQPCSGLGVWGKNLDTEYIAATLEFCCLSPDLAQRYYQDYLEEITS